MKYKKFIDFGNNTCNSIKSIAIKKNTTVKITTRLMKGKKLMFVKKPLQSFVYNVIDVFCFPTQQAINIYQQNQIIKCLLFLNLTDVDSCSLSFCFCL